MIGGGKSVFEAGWRDPALQGSGHESPVRPSGRRQPHLSIKPLNLYAPLLDMAPRLRPSDRGEKQEILKRSRRFKRRCREDFEAAGIFSIRSVPGWETSSNLLIEAGRTRTPDNHRCARETVRMARPLRQQKRGPGTSDIRPAEIEASIDEALTQDLEYSCSGRTSGARNGPGTCRSNACCIWRARPG